MSSINDIISMACLKQLGERHVVLTGLNLNWAGAYDHAAQRLIKRLEHEALWATSQRVTPER